MERANLLETLENVVPHDLLLRIAPVLSAAAQKNSLSSLRESAAARFQNGSVSGSDDEKPEPLSQSPVTDGARSPPGEHVRHMTQSKRSSMWAGDAPPQPAASRSSGSEGKRHSIWPGGSPSSAASSSARRLSLSQHAVPLQSLRAGASQDDSPSSMTASPVAQRQVQPASSALTSGTSALSKRSSMWAGDAPPQPAASRSSGSEGKRHSMWPGGSPSSAASSSARRLSLSQHAAPLLSLRAGASQDDSPSSMTASPVAQRQVQPASSAVTSGTSALSKRSSMWAGDAPPQPAASRSSGSAGRRHSMVRFA